MTSKHKVLFAIALAGLAVAVYILWEADIHAKQMARSDLIESRLEPLAFQMEEYKNSHGGYPDSLNVLLLASDTESRKVLQQALQDEFNDKYNYMRLSNGFVFTVVGPLSRFVKWETIRKMYLPGEARKDYNFAVSPETNR